MHKEGQEETDIARTEMSGSLFLAVLDLPPSSELSTPVLWCHGTTLALISLLYLFSTSWSWNNPCPHMTFPSPGSRIQYEVITITHSTIYTVFRFTTNSSKQKYGLQMMCLFSLGPEVSYCHKTLGNLLVSHNAQLKAQRCSCRWSKAFTNRKIELKMHSPILSAHIP